jgi:hypothetical protein
MVNMRRIIITGVLLAAGIITSFWFFNSDEAKIKRQFKALAELVAKDSEEHQLIAAANARKISNMFSEISRFEIPSHSISRTYKRDNIQAHVMAVRGRYSAISLKFHDLQISILEEGLAHANFTAYVELAWDLAEPFREVHELICRIEKIEKDWYIKETEIISILER